MTANEFTSVAIALLCSSVGWQSAIARPHLDSWFYSLKFSLI